MEAQVQLAQPSSLYSNHLEHKLHRIAANLAALVDVMSCCKQPLQQLISKSSATCGSLVLGGTYSLTCLS